MSIDKVDEKRVKCVLRVMEILDDEHRMMADISNIIGYKNTIKLMKYFAGEEIKFPSERVAIDDTKYIEAYVRYKLMGEPWEDMLVKVYGEGEIDTRIRQATKGRLRSFESRLKDYRSELESITLSDIEEYRELMKDKEETINED